jgi:hypothetical protein
MFGIYDISEKMFSTPQDAGRSSVSGHFGDANRR